MDSDSIFNIISGMPANERPFAGWGDKFKHLLIGDPNAKVQMPVDPHGRPFNLNLSPSQFQGEYGQPHPAMEMGLAGGMAATGAPELMTRALVNPAIKGFKAAAKAAPMTTAGATGVAASMLPTGTGKTPWEIMQENWENRRKELQGQISSEDKIINEQNARLQVSPAEQARIEKLKTDLDAAAKKWEAMKLAGRVDKAGNATDPAAQKVQGAVIAAKNSIDSAQNRGGQIDSMRKEIEGIVNPATERRKLAAQGLTDIDTEIQNAQTPIRQGHPWAGLAAIPAAAGAAKYTGSVIGKAFRGSRLSKAEDQAKLVERAEQHVADTTTQAGKASKMQFKSPEGQVLAKDLASAEGKAGGTVLGPALATATGAGVGAVEGMLPQVGFSALDAMNAPGGSPLQHNASWGWWENPKTWFGQAVPEVGLSAGAGALGALIASIKGGKGVPYGYPPLPNQPRINAYSFAAKGAQMPTLTAPKGKAAAPRGKAAATAKGAVKPKSPLEDIPDI